MSVLLVKMSLPDWEKEFTDMPSAVIELRRHICSGCLNGGEDEPPVDIMVEGRLVECLDADKLLNTSCGYEFDIEDLSEG
jgi:hypothetical protein